MGSSRAHAAQLAHLLWIGLSYCGREWWDSREAHPGPPHRLGALPGTSRGSLCPASSSVCFQWTWESSLGILDPPVLRRSRTHTLSASPRQTPSGPLSGNSGTWNCFHYILSCHQFGGNLPVSYEVNPSKCSPSTLRWHAWEGEEALWTLPLIPGPMRLFHLSVPELYPL